MKRRDFIKKGAGAFAIAAAGTVRGANAPSNRVRLGIVACARYCRGQRVLNHALKVPGVEFVYACDVLENARNWTERHLEKTTGVRPVKEKDVRKILEDKNLDGIICATPDHWHATCAVLAMQAGKHVYVEKPCAFCPEEGEIILKTQKATGKVFQMGNQRRSSEHVRKAIEAIHNGIIGETKWGKSWYMAGRKPIGNGKPASVPKNMDWDLWQGPAPRTGFRDNIVPMIKGKHVLILAVSVASGGTVKAAVDAVRYYGGETVGVAAMFSTKEVCGGFKVNSVFNPQDLPDYFSVPSHECPLCKEGKKLDAIINSHGFSKL
jgi:predicted dehydrogenase